MVGGRFNFAWRRFVFAAGCFAVTLTERLEKRNTNNDGAGGGGGGGKNLRSPRSSAAASASAGLGVAD
jgi:hypothetical protein